MSSSSGTRGFMADGFGAEDLMTLLASWRTPWEARMSPALTRNPAVLQLEASHVALMESPPISMKEELGLAELAPGSCSTSASKERISCSVALSKS